MLSYRQTPMQEISDEETTRAGIKLLVKREDLNHPYVSGNKWWKLKYNLEEAVHLQKKTLLTYGGAYSNHIYSTAAAARELNLNSIGIIRGEKTFPLNPTLSFAKEIGMTLHYIQRDAYRKKNLNDLFLQVDDCYSIPEGGTNALAVKGVAEYTNMLGEDYDYLCCPVGTGGTLAGFIQGASDSVKILGFPVLKGSHFLADEIRKFISDTIIKPNWQLIHDYHFGGYAKTTPALLLFIDRFQNTHNIPLEFVYTAKMFAGLYDLMSKGFFQRGTTVLAIHTGGIR